MWDEPISLWKSSASLHSLSNVHPNLSLCLSLTHTVKPDMPSLACSLITQPPTQQYPPSMGHPHVTHRAIFKNPSSPGNYLFLLSALIFPICYFLYCTSAILNHYVAFKLTKLFHYSVMCIQFPFSKHQFLFLCVCLENFSLYS